MADIFNLRRARKGKARAAKSATADANRIAHGIAKPVRAHARALRNKEARAVDIHKMDEKE